ncbi:hypothetical protein AeMF1_003194 [Aphanomyces euteiches]|nr:hypothetical protein AeMF1_003194 [Aphanomyces euteiches]KAH9190029.1 hypothetical protein AeNC1_007995 [Aphanomyces euteiches]
MPIDLFETTEYSKAYDSFAFCDNKADPSTRKQRASRQKSYVDERPINTASTDNEDDRVELYSGPRLSSTQSRRRRHDSTSRKQSSNSGGGEKRRSRRASQQNEDNILASFPFHSSSFKDNNDIDESSGLDENVYDYEINEADLYKYTTQPVPSKDNHVSKRSQSRNLSAGACRSSSGHCEDPVVFDRPPSRQCHAFPIHLVDQSTNDNEQEWQQRKSFKRRPPSRHKHLSRSHQQIHETFRSSCEINERSLEDTIHRFRSRRNADTRVQAHDPTRDGFEAVDETVPLPFRIEVTTQNEASPPYEKPRAPPSRRHNRNQPPPPSTATFDEMRKTLQSRAEDPVVLKIAPERRRPQPRQGTSSPFQWIKATEPGLHPFFESTSGLSPHTNWIPSSLEGESGPETNSDGVMSAGTDDLKLDDFNFSATPPAPGDSSSSLRTSLGVDFLSLFAPS